ncbi:MAG TPA: DUF192 domain-containing protein [Gemmatimonadaceae bacterium]|nr:DUF192 domain-containing protein [Gemmatimonadaceae bacterium]
MLRTPLWLSLGAVAAALACGGAQESADYSSVVRFDSASVRVVTPRGITRLRVEIAQSPEQRTMGLMERTSLPDSAGMLFLYDRDEPASAGFWMYRTRIPLDIAFMDSTGRVLVVRQMVPCGATLARGCPSYDPGVPYRAALEVKAGVLARNGIAPGARLELPVRKRS